MSKNVETTVSTNEEEEQVLEWLKPVFPQLSTATLRISVQHPSNRIVPFDRARLLQRCIDDLLELRTMKLSNNAEFSTGDLNISVDESVIVIDSEQSQENIIQKSVKTKEEILQEQVNDICNMFPDILPKYVHEQIAKYNGENSLNCVVQQILENPSYPTNPKKDNGIDSNKFSSGPSDIDYYTDFRTPMPSQYKKDVLNVLEMDFLKVPKQELRNILHYYCWHYAPTRKCLVDAYKEKGIETEVLGSILKESSASSLNSSLPANSHLNVKIDGIAGSKTLKIKLLKKGRQRRKYNSQLSEALKAEIDYIIRKTHLEKQEKDHLLAMTINDTEYEEMGQLIECGCCFQECSFETMIQCFEGHLFCKECLVHYAKEAVFGGGKVNLLCMTSGCEASYPKSQLEISLPSKILAKYEDRLQEESINLADIEGLVRCPNCDFAALLHPENKVFRCQKCFQETCRYCNEDWSEHIGIPCSELEKKDETKLRIKFEEKMTAAKVRTCHRCKASIIKIDGCNKMTCRCGAKMCYICRKRDIDYNHFCRHVRDPGQPCSTCKDCSLWTNPEEDDDRAVEEIKKEAQKKRKEEGYAEDREIGVPNVKKQKLSH